MTFWSRGGGSLLPLKVNFQVLFTVANVLQILPAPRGFQRLLNIELVELQRLAAMVGHGEVPEN